MVSKQFSEVVGKIKKRLTMRAADLVVRAAKNRRLGEELFSVSLVGPPTKPLTQAVRRTNAESVYVFRVFDFLVR